MSIPTELTPDTSAEACATPSHLRHKIDPTHSFSEHRAAGLVAALASAAAFGASGPFVKPLLDAGWSPTAAVAVRAAVRRAPSPPARTGGGGLAAPGVATAWRRIVTFGLVAVGGTQLCYFAAIQRLPVGVALLIEYLGPVLLVGFVWLRPASDRRASRSWVRPSPPVGCSWCSISPAPPGSTRSASRGRRWRRSASPATSHCRRNRSSRCRR